MVTSFKTQKHQRKRNLTRQLHVSHPIWKSAQQENTHRGNDQDILLIRPCRSICIHMVLCMWCCAGTHVWPTQWCTIHSKVQGIVTLQIKQIQINATGKMHLSINLKFLKLKQKAFGPLSRVEIAKWNERVLEFCCML